MIGSLSLKITAASSRGKGNERVSGTSQTMLIELTKTTDFEIKKQTCVYNAKFSQRLAISDLADKFVDKFKFFVIFLFQ